MRYRESGRRISPMLRRADSAVLKLVSEILSEASLAPGQFAILLLVGENPGRSQSWLAREAMLERQNIVPVIDRLESLGYLQRRRSTKDRRSLAIHITGEGERVLDRIGPRLTQFENELNRLFTDADRAILLAALHKLEAYARSGSIGPRNTDTAIR